MDWAAVRGLHTNPEMFGGAGHKEYSPKEKIRIILDGLRGLVSLGHEYSVKHDLTEFLTYFLG